MAMETPCQTDGAMFSIHVMTTGISARVTFGKNIELTKEQAIILQANIHNALELVLAPYFS